MSTRDSITIVRANRRRLAKKIHRGTIAGYDQVKTADLIEKPIADLRPSNGYFDTWTSVAIALSYTAPQPTQFIGTLCASSGGDIRADFSGSLLTTSLALTCWICGLCRN
jgi:hypothetical protein